jgi:hypothetical protein
VKKQKPGEYFSSSRGIIVRRQGADYTYDENALHKAFLDKVTKHRE